MSSIKNIIKNLLFKFIRGLAIKGSTNKAIILNYHRVIQNTTEIQLGSISAKEFKNKIIFLKKHFNIISFPELLERKKKQ